MTLTLHLYDDDGTELAWATKEPFGYRVSESLPAETGDELGSILRKLENDFVDTATNSFGTRDGKPYVEMGHGVEPDDRSAEERLEQAGSFAVGTGVAASYELTDD